MSTERNILLLGAAIIIAAFAVWGTPASDARQSARTEMAHYKAAHPDCEACGSKATTLLRRNEVHHIIPVSVETDKADDTGNMITLCRPCHICLGHAGDGACRRYCPNIRDMLAIRIVKENR